MTRRHRWCLVPALVGGLAWVAVGCGDATGAKAPDSSASPVSTETSDVASAEESVPYALLEGPGWTLQEAVDWLPDNVLAGREPVASDWWAEYERFESSSRGTEGQALKLTGFTVGLDAYRSAMEPLGMSFEAVEASLGRGLTGTTAEQGSRPVVVAVPFGDGTLELLSYELSSDELVALVADVVTVDDAGWRAAGGQVR